uniref:Putative secreted protein n=1 Tax=Ixodes ricinus TaxID=34613 RepID=A0A6B0USS1_IXORI
MGLSSSMVVVGPMIVGLIIGRHVFDPGATVGVLRFDWCGVFVVPVLEALFRVEGVEDELGLGDLDGGTVHFGRDLLGLRNDDGAVVEAEQLVVLLVSHGGRVPGLRLRVDCRGVCGVGALPGRCLRLAAVSTWFGSK